MEADEADGNTMDGSLKGVDTAHNCGNVHSSAHNNCGNVHSSAHNNCGNVHPSAHNCTNIHASMMGKGHDETESLTSSLEYIEDDMRCVPVDEAPEGGWGWMVLIGSLFNTFIMDGIGGGFGLLYPYIMDKFDATASVVSFAGSLFVSYMIMGSISAWLVNRFGDRLVSMTGGVLCCLSFVAAAFCKNIYVFILTFGLFAGCSTGLVYLPSVVVVNHYFSKKRGLANGILSSGAGAGLVVMAPLLTSLLEMYSLQGTVLIVGGIALNMSMFSSLFFPIMKSHHSRTSDIDSSVSVMKPFQTMTEAESKSGVGLTLTDVNGDNQFRNSVDCETMTSDQYSIDIEEIDLQKDRVRSNGVNSIAPSLKVNELEHSHHLHPHPGLSRIKLDHVFLNNAWRSEQKLSSQNQNEKYFSKVTSHYSVDNVAHLSVPANTIDSKQQTIGHANSTNLTCPEYGSHLYLIGSISTLQTNQNRYLQQRNQSSINTPSSHLQSRSRSRSKHLSDSHLSHKARELNDVEADTSHGRSNYGHTAQGEGQGTGTFPRSSPNASQMSAVDDSPLLNVASVEVTRVENTLRNILIKPVFAVFCLGACLIQIGYPVIGTFLVDYASEQGVNSGQNAFILSVMGGSNIVGRLLAGSLASLGLDPLYLHNMTLLLGAVVCLLCPIYTSFWALCVFAAMFGFFMGFFPPLQPLIIVEYFGLAALGPAFGFLSMVKGLATICGPPMAGLIYDSCHDYSMSIVFAGSAIALSSLVHQTMTCFKR